MIELLRGGYSLKIMDKKPPFHLAQDLTLVFIGFAATVLIASYSNTGLNNKLLKTIDLSSRQLKACYYHSDDTTPLGEYRANCKQDSHGFFTRPNLE